MRWALDHSGADEALFIGDRRASASELNAYYADWGRIEGALEAAARAVAAALCSMCSWRPVTPFMVAVARPARSRLWSPRSDYRWCW